MSSRDITFTVTSKQPSYLSSLLQSLAPGEFSVDFGAESGINESKGWNGLLPGESGFVASVPPRPTFVADNGSNYTTISWPGKAVFDPVSNCWFYVGGTTGQSQGSMTIHRYSVADNKWRHWQGETEYAEGVFINVGNAHNFGSTGIDPIRRKLYHLCTQGPPTGSTQETGIGRWGLDTAPGTFPSDKLVSPTGISNGKYRAADACPTEGVFLCIEWSSTSLGSSIYRWDLDTGATLSRGSRLFNDLVRSATCYLKLPEDSNGKVYSTGDSNRFYSTNPLTGQMTWLSSDPTPVQMDGMGNVSYQYTNLVPLNGCVYAFVMCPSAVGRGVYRYDPRASAGSRWSGNLAVNFPIINSGPETAEGKWSAGPIESENAVLLATTSATSDNLNRCYVWREP